MGPQPGLHHFPPVILRLYRTSPHPWKGVPLGEDFDLQKARGELQEIAKILETNQQKMKDMSLELESEKSAHVCTKVSL
ncbi:hypothetical protein L1987_50992 [Smallanthus sonchifolius]|uniref:Uncharacterized protein n=1 Tax=Smallanthus sonchifolius TaxID=185202 RepID=A0ACB9EPM9_9ASTR|nr:hypothetical protein L1987_50992 [Smallanthus sonchifolius]